MYPHLERNVWLSEPQLSRPVKLPIDAGGKLIVRLMVPQLLLVGFDND